jgi:tetratricopeptide (TPR) repeat protein
MPDELDQTAGNAAPMWIRSGMSARGVRHKWTPAEDKWLGHNESEGGTALKNLPRKDVKQLLDKYDQALRLAEKASLRKRCDWEHPPLTVQTINDIPFEDIQLLRELIRVVSLRCRLELAEGRYEDAMKSLRVGVTMARQVGDSEFMIQDLVAVALGSIMIGRVEEWMQIPGSPNLYWALSELPRPLVEVRRSIKSELNTIYRSFPEIRELKSKKLSNDEARALVEKLLVTFYRSHGEAAPDWKVKVGITALTLKYYPVAKKALIACGRSEKEVESLPSIQAVALYCLEEYDRKRDEIGKLLALPLWQGYPEMEKLAHLERGKKPDEGNVPVGLLQLLVPALVKVFHAQVRTERYIDSLRAAEALRLYIAKHGKAPARWSDITEVPLPIDPYTGKGFDAWYSVKGGKAILDVPPLPGQTARLGRRFEFDLQKR